MLNLVLGLVLISLYIWADYNQFNDIKDRYENNEKLNKAF